MRTASAWCLIVVFIAGCISWDSPNPEAHHPFGVVQKGPFAAGSEVTIQALDHDLEPSGKTYIVFTEDEFGRFALPDAVTARFLEIIGEGFYWDEFSQELSTSPLTLRGYCDLTEDERCNANLLTTIVADRMQDLVELGEDFSIARQSATEELFSAFGIEGISANSDDFEIAGPGNENAALLAVSLLTLRMARSETPSHLAELLSTLSTDLSDDGEVTLSTAGTFALRGASVGLQLDVLRTNLESFYASDSSAVIPPFEDFIDSDGDGTLNRDDDPPLLPLVTINGGGGGGWTCWGAQTLVVGTTFVVSNPCGSSGPPYMGGLSLFDRDGESLGGIDNPSPWGNPPDYLFFGRSIAPGPLPSTIAASSVGAMAPGPRISVVEPGVGTVFTLFLTSALTGSPRIATSGTALLIGLSLDSSGGVAGAGRIDVYGPDGDFVRRLELPSPDPNAHLGDHIATLEGTVFASVDAGTPQARVVGIDISTGGVTTTLLAPSGWGSFGTSIDIVAGLVAVGGFNTNGAFALFDTRGTLISTLASTLPWEWEEFGTAISSCGDLLLVGAGGGPAAATAGSGSIYAFEQDGTLVDRIVPPGISYYDSVRSLSGPLGTRFAASSIDYTYLYECP